MAPRYLGLTRKYLSFLNIICAYTWVDQLHAGLGSRGCKEFVVFYLRSFKPNLQRIFNPTMINDLDGQYKTLGIIRDHQMSRVNSIALKKIELSCITETTDEGTKFMDFDSFLDSLDWATVRKNAWKIMRCRGAARYISFGVYQHQWSAACCINW
jgi:hypothetical protein